MTAIDRNMLKSFAMESADRLEQIAADLEQLSDFPGEKEIIADLFRETHNLKGAANLVGVRAVELLAHTLEDLLDLLRDGRQPFDEQLAAILEAGYGRISEILKNPQVLKFIDVSRDVNVLKEHLEKWRKGS